MVEQNNSGIITEIVYTPGGAKLAIMSGANLKTAFVGLPGGSTAVYNSSGLAYYRHSDWLGSSRFASTPTRTMYSDAAYGPFGEPYAQSGTSDVSFTGMNQDTVANLYDFPAREYGTQGRWPSPDPSGISSVRLTDPQSFDRYAYTGNSPMGFVDPTGMVRTPPGLVGGGDGYLLGIAASMGFGSGPAFGENPFGFAPPTAPDPTQGSCTDEDCYQYGSSQNSGGTPPSPGQEVCADSSGNPSACYAGPPAPGEPFAINCIASCSGMSVTEQDIQTAMDAANDCSADDVVDASGPAQQQSGEEQTGEVEQTATGGAAVYGCMNQHPLSYMSPSTEDVPNPWVDIWFTFFPQK
jgi:RHS repeat-associated protein